MPFENFNFEASAISDTKCIKHSECKKKCSLFPAPQLMMTSTHFLVYSVHTQYRSQKKKS